MKIKVIKIL